MLLRSIRKRPLLGLSKICLQFLFLFCFVLFFSHSNLPILNAKSWNNTVNVLFANDV